MTNPPHPLAVERVEMVSYENGFEETAEPILRIVINGYCADFPSEGAARNFAEAIHALLAGAFEAAACEMELAAHIMSHHGSDLETQAYQNAAKSIRALATDAARDALASIERRAVEAAADRAEQHLRTNGIEGVLSAIRGEKGNG